MAEAVKRCAIGAKTTLDPARISLILETDAKQGWKARACEKVR